MRRRVPKAVSLCMMAGLMAAGLQGIQAGATETDVQTELTEETAAEEGSATEDSAEVNIESDTSMAGELAFAKCDEYINVRSAPNTDSDVVAKLYNFDSAMILSQADGWYEIQSGNAYGYVKAEYFATGEEADSIAQGVAYNVATVQAEELNIRKDPHEEGGVIGVAYSQDELEVVAYDGDWMKVALGDDVYGYINAYYVTYDTYYPTAETLEEEAARLNADSPEETEAVEDEYTEEVYEETEAVYTEAVYTETEAAYTEPVYTETEAAYTEPAYTETEAVYTEPVYTETETVYTEPAYTETVAVYTEPVYTETEAVYTEPVYTETEAVYTETEPVYTETEAVYTETEAVYTETEASSASDSSAGQQIVDYAMQYVGNPYQWGGTSLTNGADCSGFTQSVFANSGIDLARVASDQASGGTSVSVDELQPGDLLFYGSSSGIDHVAIYAGDGTIVHAANSNSGITTSNAYYSDIVDAKRYW